MRYLDGSAVRLFDIVDGGDGQATVVGIADSDQYAPAFQPPTPLNRDAGVLVVFPDGSLKWRPLPGVPLRFCKHSAAAIDQRIETRVLPVTAIPAYHGFYVDGQRIRLLDVVETPNGGSGQVVAIISERLYSAGFDPKDWGYLGAGFLVDSPGTGLEWFKDADEDLKLLRRSG